MTLICYTSKRFAASSMELIDTANVIIEDYRDQGFILTLRQLYYQFVSRDMLPNSQKSYDRLGAIISDARLAGLVSWSAIEDRTRHLRTHPAWESPREILEAVSKGYARDLWEGQDYRPEVWIEKDALVGVIEPICRELNVPYYACRGYNSQSEHWAAAQRIKERDENENQITVILHLGDHDPSGIDMTRDIKDRFGVFEVGDCVLVRRLALNIEQVNRYKPPPNPAKLTDARAVGYIEKFGPSSWELDALEPSVIAAVIRDAVDRVRDLDKWEEAVERERAEREKLTALIASLE